MVETTRPAGLDIETPKTMPSFEEFDQTARKHFMLWLDFSKAEADEYYDTEDVQRQVRYKYEEFLEDVQKDPKKLRYFGSRIRSLNGCLWLMY